MATMYPDEDEEIMIVNGRVVKSGQNKQMEFDDIFKPKDPAYFLSSGSVQKGDMSHKRPETSEEDIFKPKDPAYVLSSGAVQKGDMSHKRESNFDDIFKPKDPAYFLSSGKVTKGDNSHKTEVNEDDIFKPKDPAYFISSGQVKRGDTSGPQVGVPGLGRLAAAPSARKTLTEEEVMQQYYKSKGVILAPTSTSTDGIDLEKFSDPSEQSHPYSSLRTKPFPEGVDPTRRELYLSDEEFQQLFQMPKAEFAGLQKWKQDSMKKKLKLF